MASWFNLFRKPSKLTDDRAADWFDRVAEQLLNGTRLVVNREPHRFTEVEFYYFAPEHPDPFTHRDPLQLECGRWYFHRSRGAYRRRSFKGLDLTFGGDGAHSGILIRGLEKANGELVDGPSLCVDHLLDVTGAGDVAALDEAIAGRDAWDATNPLRLEEANAGPAREVYRTARIGLSLKRSKKAPEPPRYVLRPYRYLTEPRRIAKGKAQLVLALHAQGMSPEEIHNLCGCPKGTVQRYIKDFEEGRQDGDFDPYYGIDLAPKELCRLHGVWHARWVDGKA
jgi:hypothetical protein